MLIRTLLASALIVAACVGTASCAHPRYVAPPIRVQAAPAPIAPAPKPALDLDKPPEELFRLGREAYERGLREDALTYFAAVLERHPQSPRYAEAAYNAGLMAEKLARYEKAREYFTALLSTNASAKDKTDARFRLLVCDEALKNYEEILAQSAELLAAKPPLSAEDRVEAQARRGAALFHLGRMDEAKRELESAVQSFGAALRREEISDEGPGAMAYCYLGHIAAKAFSEAPLALGEASEMAGRMEAKAQRLLDAQDLYLAAIKQDNAFWATAAGLAIGGLYKEFYAAIRAVPAPGELAPDSEEARMYHCVLGKQARVLLRKSMRIFEQTLAMAQRLHMKGAPVSDTQLALENVKALYAEESEACAGILPPDSAPAPSAAPLPKSTTQK